MSIKSVMAVVVFFSVAEVAGTALLAAPARSTVANAPTCDRSLWKRVYNPSRLEKVSDCVSATGVVSESNADDDGDQHFLIRLDKGQKELLNKRNKKKKEGDLVAEIVCANPVKLKRVKKTCVGYQNTIPIPPVGSHVRVTGSYVIDSHNGWAEIHPVSSVELIK